VLVPWVGQGHKVRACPVLLVAAARRGAVPTLSR
jgi:hypothetical protein